MNTEKMHRKKESFKARTVCSPVIRAISGIWSDFVFLFAIVNNIINPILFVSLFLSGQTGCFEEEDSRVTV